MYGIRLSRHDYRVLELADLAANLPPGCALWQASGGPQAWTDQTHMLARIEHGIRVLAWYKTEDAQAKPPRNPPKPKEPPKPGREVREEQARKNRRAQAWKARQDRIRARQG